MREEENSFMKKVLTWILNHLRIILALIVFPVTLLVIGGIVLNSYTSYQAYEKRYDAIDLDVRSQNPAAPKKIEFEDGFKSSLKNELSFNAADMKVTTTQTDYLMGDYIDLTEKGGNISFALTLEEKSFVDIVFSVSSEYKTTVDDNDVYGVENLLANANFIVNGETMEDIVDLPNSGNGPEFHNLVMVGFALPAGNINVTISSVSGKLAMMPQLQRVAFYANAAISVAE